MISSREDLRGTHSSSCPFVERASRGTYAPPKVEFVMNFFSYTDICNTLGAPLKSASRSLSKLTPSQLTPSGSGNLKRTTLPHEAGALGPELLCILRGSVDALSSVRALCVRGAFEASRFKRRRAYAVTEGEPPGAVKFSNPRSQLG